jgi:hypothetical protein
LNPILDLFLSPGELLPLYVDESSFPAPPLPQELLLLLLQVGEKKNDLYLA